MSLEDEFNASPFPSDTRACDICSVHRWKTELKDIVLRGVGEDYGQRRNNRLTSALKLWESATQGSCPTCDFIWRGVTYFNPGIKEAFKYPESFTNTINIRVHESGKLPLSVEITGQMSEETVEFYTDEGRPTICCGDVFNCL